MTLLGVFRVLSVAVALALGALMLYAGEPDNPWWWAGLPFALWVIGPAVAPFLIAIYKPRQWLSITMFLYFVASSLFAGLAYQGAFFRSTSSTAALVMIFIPLYQWLALALLLFLCAGVKGWRRRSHIHH